MQIPSPKNKNSHFQSISRNQSAMTLIEITVVITILLSLVGIVFVGLTSYNKGSARAKCILQQSKLQKTSIAYANLNEIDEGAPVANFVNTLISAGYIQQTPVCPDTGNYTFLDKIPNQTESFVTCSIASHISN
ncbi:MAG: type II secretion system GspH family protein [Verrucomicrobiales bacterium]|nr:type II secretion system GspH family protein [Verrucomicrobiales bacterium]